MTKITITGVQLTPKKKEEIISDVEECLKDVLKQNQEITEINIIILYINIGINLEWYVF